MALQHIVPGLHRNAGAVGKLSAGFTVDVRCLLGQLATMVDMVFSAPARQPVGATILSLQTDCGDSLQTSMSTPKEQ
ncbi:hypothetical protein CCHOA_02465 [Corynebacterium choanae]|uniref:Uncharacterized protein n=1 Tax=Corynebacterium choanae TaxID=1862358 RepID=A0A3G6J8X7_9CORY|nr:hypothetical protein CCHOA_02465 [Corynebacterium choanae]